MAPIKLLLFCYLLVFQPQLSKGHSYWIWAGLTPADAPADAELIVYQGNFVSQSGQLQFEHKGIYASPLKQSQIQLVFRLHEIQNPLFIVDTIERYIRDWRRHSVVVTGIQLDFDSPSAKLSEYASFLYQVREKLSIDLGFSITGLGTWLMDADAVTLRQLHAQVDTITYQLYVGRAPVRYPQRYINFLLHLKHPFKVGLLYNQQPLERTEQLQVNPAFKGFSYFIQK